MTLLARSNNQNVSTPTPNLSAFDLEAYLAAPASEISAESPVAYEDALIDLFYGASKDAGPTLPWTKTHNLARFRPGEVTLWAGINGHGKSQITGQVALDMANQGEKVAIGSFEMAPERTLYRMVRQAGRTAAPSIRYIKAFIGWCEGRIWVLNKRGMVNADYVIAAIRYCRDKFGITQFFVDNLTKCVKGDDDYNGQKDLVDALISVAADLGIHIHIIHHIRKGISEFDVPGKFDAKGAGAITDLVDNVIIVWRNKKKEYNSANPKPDPKVAAESDALLVIAKQRNGGFEGRIGLWYHSDAMAYSEDNVGRPPRYDISTDHADLI